jgi:hypothetical protein
MLESLYNSNPIWEEKKVTYRQVETGLGRTTPPVYAAWKTPST